MGEVSERAIRIAEEISRRTICEHYRLVLNEERTPDIKGSKIGGLPYWPTDMDYPVDANGDKMLLIMQINCQEAGLTAPLPEHGMIQWFISINPELMYGCRGNYDDQSKGFRIIYHETVDTNITSQDIKAMNIPTHDNVDQAIIPVKREVAINAVVEDTMMGVSDGRFNQAFFDIIYEITGVEQTGKMWYDYMDNDDCLYFEQNMGMKRPCHQMLGYPVFSQEDARRDLKQHDALLLQLDSQFSTIDQKELVMWGDMGSGYIFINRDDLEELDFSRAYYCWDCG